MPSIISKHGKTSYEKQRFMDGFMLEVWYFWKTVQLPKSLLIYINWKHFKFNHTFSATCLKPTPNLASICNPLVRLECLPSASSLQRIEVWWQLSLVPAGEFHGCGLRIPWTQSWVASTMVITPWLWQLTATIACGSDKASTGEDTCSLVPALVSQGNKRTGFSWVSLTTSWDGLRWRELRAPRFLGRQEVEFTVCTGTGQQNETTMRVPVGGCSQPRLWPGKRRNKESRNHIYSQSCS